MTRLLPLGCLLLAACAAPPEHFFERPSANVDRPRVRVVNETAGAVYVTLRADTGAPSASEGGEEPAAAAKIELPPWSFAIHELEAGVYDYQIFIEGRREFPAKWFSHGPQGRVELRLGHRYAWRWRKP